MEHSLRQLRYVNIELDGHGKISNAEGISLSWFVPGIRVQVLFPKQSDFIRIIS